MHGAGVGEEGERELLGDAPLSTEPHAVIGS